MHPFLLLLGTAAITYSQTLGHTLVAGIVATVGGLVVALAKRSKIPMLKNLPQLAPQGSTPAIVLSVLTFLAGGAMLGISTELVSNPALSIFLPVLGTGLLMMFDSADVTGIGAVPAVTLLMVLGMAGAPACAHVQPVSTCTEAKLGDRGPAIFAEVAGDLAMQNWSDLLLNLGPQLGWDVLSCVLSDLEKNKDPIVAGRAKLFEKQQAAKLHQ